MLSFDDSRVLIISAHPDDEVLGCGGILARQKHKTEFYCLFLAEGSSARFAGDQLDSRECSDAIDYRNECSRKALSFLNVKRHQFLNYRCGALDNIPIIELNHHIEKVINSYCPDVVITHSNFDCNNDHRIVSRAVDMATRPKREGSTLQLLHFEVQSTSELNYLSPFAPNLFLELSQEWLDMKIEAMSLYDGEYQLDDFSRSPSSITVLARYRGIQSGYKYAEAFKLVRSYSPALYPE
jgi:LmbE family N-acetylglucosaminyl deacetylase